MKHSLIPAFLCALVTAAPASALTIAKNGTAKVAIIVAVDASAPVVHAAEELSSFLEQVTGAKFPAPGTAAGGGRILVGPGAAKKALPDFSAKGLGSDGIMICTVGKDLVLAGGHPRGTLYAVYTFLEEQVGCLWWSSKVSTIPKQPTLKIDELNTSYIPVLEYREPFWMDAFDGDFAVRNKCNGNSERLDEKRGGKLSYEGHVHTFNRLIPPDKYFDKHPEWFSEIKGKRMRDRSQLCLTNEEMQKELILNLRQRLKHNPAARIASVSQNDWYNCCTCKKCAAVDAKEGSHAGTMLRFVNAVAADIENDFPNVTISTLAYQYTRMPPLKARPRHNVIVRLCSIECSFSKPLSDDRNSEFRDDILGWSRICNRLYVWDYTTNFSHHILPHPNLRVLGPNVKFFVANGVKGLFEQGAYTTMGAEMAELRAWVLAKLLWNPKLDAEELIDAFLTGYYGPGGEHIRAYLDVMHDAVDASGDKLGCFSTHASKFLSFAVINQGWAHLKAAEHAVKDDPALLHRVQVVQLPTLYALMMRWEHYRKAAAGADWPVNESAREVYKHFMAVAERKGVTRLNEWQKGFDRLEQTVNKIRTTPTPTPTPSSVDGMGYCAASVRKLQKTGDGGFTVFNYAVGEARDIVPLTGLAVTRKQGVDSR